MFLDMASALKDLTVETGRTLQARNLSAWPAVSSSAGLLLTVRMHMRSRPVHQAAGPVGPTGPTAAAGEFAERLVDPDFDQPTPFTYRLVRSLLPRVLPAHPGWRRPRTSGRVSAGGACACSSMVVTSAGNCGHDLPQAGRAHPLLEAEGASSAAHGSPTDRPCRPHGLHWVSRCATDVRNCSSPPVVECAACRTSEISSCTADLTGTTVLADSLHLRFCQSPLFRHVEGERLGRPLLAAKTAQTPPRKIGQHPVCGGDSPK